MYLIKYLTKKLTMLKDVLLLNSEEISKKKETACKEVIRLDEELQCANRLLERIKLLLQSPGNEGALTKEKSDTMPPLELLVNPYLIETRKNRERIWNEMVELAKTQGNIEKYQKIVTQANDFFRATIDSLKKGTSSFFDKFFGKINTTTKEKGERVELLSTGKDQESSSILTKIKRFFSGIIGSIFPNLFKGCEEPNNHATTGAEGNMDSPETINPDLLGRAGKSFSFTTVPPTTLDDVNPQKPGNAEEELAPKEEKVPVSGDRPLSLTPTLS